MSKTGMILAAGLGLASAASASAQTFYEGKTITIVVGSDSGGGYDLYARTISRHMGRHIPGRPTIIVQNMPGAGSARAAEFLSVIAPKDGSTIGLIFPGMIVEPLLQPGRFRFDPTKFGYLGSADSGTRLCVTYKTSKIRTFADAMREASTFGGSAPGSSTTDYAQMFNNLAGTRFKIVNGYKSSNDTVLAMERGEVDGICGYDSSSFRSQKPTWFGTPEANIIVQAALEPAPELTQLGVPHIWQFVSGENRAVAEVVLAQQEFHRPFVTPPGVPADRLDILRKAFMATLADADFLADATRMKLSITPKDWDTVTRLIAKIYASPPELIAKVNKALRP